MLARMADHYLRAVEQAERAADLASRLEVEHERRTKNPARIAQLHEGKRDALALAKIHTGLFVGCAIEELRLNR